jgi:hypothetical protein
VKGLRDVIETTLHCHSHDRIYRNGAADFIESEVEAELSARHLTAEEVIDALALSIDRHTVYFGDDGPSPWMHMAVMGEITLTSL